MTIFMPMQTHNPRRMLLEKRALFLDLDCLVEAQAFFGQVWRPGLLSTQGRSYEWRRTRARSAHPLLICQLCSIVLAWWYQVRSIQVDAYPDGRRSRRRCCHHHKIWRRPCLGPKPCHGRLDVQRHAHCLLHLPQAHGWIVCVGQDQELQEEEGFTGEITSKARECHYLK